MSDLTGFKKAQPSQEVSPEDKAAFDQLNAKPYAEQAKWFMNSFWKKIFEDDAKERENIWIRTETFIKLDLRGKDGHELDEFNSHKFLETLGETLTALELRNQLRQIDLDMNGHMSLSEYLLFKYKQKVSDLVRPQADPVEVKKAAEKVQAAQEAMQEAQSKAQQLKAALEETKEAEAAAAEALAELKKQEDAYNEKLKDLEEKSTKGGVVTRNKAAAELAQMKAEDPLPLRRAKITQEAAVRKLGKSRKKSEAAAEAADAAAVEAEAKFTEAKDYLEDVKSRVGSSEGSFWWMEREMEEAKKYLPSSKKTVKAIA